MPKSTTKSARPLPSIASLMTGQVIVLVSLAWGVFTLLFFMLFSVTPPGEDSPFWYLLGTYVLETAPFMLATWLCYRNWQSPQIASGREVWFFIGLGLGCYTFANFLFGIWELYFGLDPAISPADFFYLGFTAFVGWGMILAVLPRRLNLETHQWLIITGVAIAGIGLSVLFAVITSEEEAALHPPVHPRWSAPAFAQEAPPPSPAPAAPTDPNVVPPPAPGTPPAEATETPQDLPGWVRGLDNFLLIFERPVNFFYLISDIALLVIASTLLLAFWGGRFSQSWRMIAAAAFAKYVADLSLKVSSALPGDYESGGLLEACYVFSGLLYAVGAALEFDVSTSTRGRGRRRRGGA